MKSFTLTELLVVMSIMLLLMVAVIPVYRHCVDWTLDVMPEALRYTRAIAMQGTYAAMLIRQDKLGTWSICMEVQRIPVTPLSGPIYETVIDLDTKRMQIPDGYQTALVVYGSDGHLINGFGVLIEGQPYTSTNQLVLDGEVRMLHRYLGGFAGPLNHDDQRLFGQVFSSTLAFAGIKHLQIEQNNLRPIQ